MTDKKQHTKHNTGMVSISCSTCGTRRVACVITNPEIEIENSTAFIWVAISASYSFVFIKESINYRIGGILSRYSPLNSGCNINCRVHFLAWTARRERKQLAQKVAVKVRKSWIKLWGSKNKFNSNIIRFIIYNISYKHFERAKIENNIFIYILML